MEDEAFVEEIDDAAAAKGMEEVGADPGDDDADMSGLHFGDELGEEFEADSIGIAEVFDAEDEDFGFGLEIGFDGFEVGFEFGRGAEEEFTFEVVDLETGAGGFLGGTFANDTLFGKDHGGEFDGCGARDIDEEGEEGADEDAELDRDEDSGEGGRSDDGGVEFGGSTVVPDSGDIDHAGSGHEEDTGEGGAGDELGEGGEEEDGEGDHPRADDTGPLGGGTGLVIDIGAGEGAGTGEAMKEATGEIGEPFAEALLVDIEFLAGFGGDRFGHGDGFEEAEEGDGRGAGDEFAGHFPVEGWEGEAWEGARYFLDEFDSLGAEIEVPDDRAGENDGEEEIGEDESEAAVDPAEGEDGSDGEEGDGEGEEVDGATFGHGAIEANDEVIVMIAHGFEPEDVFELIEDEEDGGSGGESDDDSVGDVA